MFNYAVDIALKSSHLSNISESSSSSSSAECCQNPSLSMNPIAVAPLAAGRLMKKQQRSLLSLNRIVDLEMSSQQVGKNRRREEETKRRRDKEKKRQREIETKRDRDKERELAVDDQANQVYGVHKTSLYVTYAMQKDVTGTPFRQYSTLLERCACHIETVFQLIFDECDLLWL